MGKSSRNRANRLARRAEKRQKELMTDMLPDMLRILCGSPLWLRLRTAVALVGGGRKVRTLGAWLMLVAGAVSAGGWVVVGIRHVLGGAS